MVRGEGLFGWLGERRWTVCAPVSMTVRMSAYWCCAPLGAEAVGDFSIGGAGAQCALGFVIGRGNVAIGHEDEEVGAELFDRGFPLDSGGMDGGHGQDPVELGFEASFVEIERGVVPCVAPLRPRRRPRR